jgi:hypothetical protein
VATPSTCDIALLVSAIGILFSNFIAALLPKYQCFALFFEIPLQVDVVSTVKTLELVAVKLFTVTFMAPVVAPAGTITVRLVADAAVTTATIPLKCTLFSETVVLKSFPKTVTVVPTNPEVGENEVIDGTVKLLIETKPESLSIFIGFGIDFMLVSFERSKLDLKFEFSILANKDVTNSKRNTVIFFILISF